MLLRDGRNPDRLERGIEAWHGELRSVFRDDEQAFEQILSYIAAVAKFSLEQLRQLAARIDPAAETIMNTLAETLRQEGLERGLVKLLELKFGPLDAAARQRIANADRDQVDRWYERVLTATTLSDVIA